MVIAFKHLTSTDDGRAHIVGRRLTPYDLLCQRELGRSPEDIAEGYNLTLAAVYEALAYAAEHADEMESIRADNANAERELLAALPEKLTRGSSPP
ncbi:MAG TPA: DUF433 domain-containing protein [Chloroflexota bacterium]|nr:DUF433 domain-containing protein [Chloroflexota bacterium]